MADEYIRKADAIGAIWHSIDGELFGELESCAHAVIGDADNAIESLEPADVAPVCRCEDCRYYSSRRWCELHSSVFDDNAFCSYGERKEE